MKVTFYALHQKSFNAHVQKSLFQKKSSILPGKNTLSLQPVFGGFGNNFGWDDFYLSTPVREPVPNYQYLAKEFEDLNNLGSRARYKLNEVIEKGDETTFETLLSLHNPSSINSFVPKIPAKRSYDNTPFLQAIQSGQYKMAQKLFKAGMSPYLRGVDNQSALHACIKSQGKVSSEEQELFLKWLLEIGCPIDAEDKNQSTAVHDAVPKCNVNILKILLEQNPNLEIAAEYYGTPLTKLSKLFSDQKLEMIQIAKMLLEKGAKPLFPAIESLKTKAIEIGDKESLLYFHKISPSPYPLRNVLFMDNVSLDMMKTIVGFGDPFNQPHEFFGSILEDAIEYRQEKHIANLIKIGCTLKESLNKPPLHLKAIGKNELHLIQTLTKAARDKEPPVFFDWIKATDENGLTALEKALTVKNIPLFQWVWQEAEIQFMREKNSNPEFQQATSLADYFNQLDIKTKKPLMHIIVSSYRENIPLIPWLIQKGLNASALNSQGENLIHQLADVWNYYPEVHPLLPLLIENGVNPDFVSPVTLNTPLHNACERNSIQMVENLLKLPIINIQAKGYQGNSPLHIAAQNGLLEIFNLLMKKGAKTDSLNDKGFLPLHMAAQPYSLYIEKEQFPSNIENIIEQLLAAPGADINAKDNEGNTPLHLASSYFAHHFITQYLLNKGAQINSQNHHFQSPLHIATPANTTILLKHGAEINIKDDKGQTPLYNSSIEKLKLLIAHHPNLTTQDLKGQTPLHGASPEKMALLLEKMPNLNVNIQDKEGKTPLHNASLDILQLLLSLKPDVNLKDFQGLSPLNTRIHKTQITDEPLKEIKMLIEAGANVNETNSEGQTLLDQVVQLKKKNFPYPLLLEHGAQGTPASLAQIFVWKKQHDSSKLPTTTESMNFVAGLSQFLLNHPLSDLTRFLDATESFYDHHPVQRNYHPNEAELMLLIRHPDIWGGKDHSISQPLSTCLTSISHFIDIGARLSDKTFTTWGNLGFLTHGFRFWRYDAIGGSSSLLSDFGFKPAPESRPFNEIFGHGFLYQDPESSALIEFRRGYLLVSQPNMGTLIVRNSSPAFGRDLLRHPAYFMKQALTASEILTFNPQTLSDEQSVLSRDHYPHQTNESTDSENAITDLTNILLNIKNKYRMFKLDTEAFQQQEFIGHLSPGLPKLVKHLNRLQSTGKPLPDLAFTHPEYPIYQPYSYFDADMKKTDRFELSPAHLTEINDFISGSWRPEKYPHSDWIRFLSQAGVENRGELVMIEPLSSIAKA
ncbi:MAG: ankyrin repeat domain-containing protein [Cyanobacteria bacterium]|nr:ankyrin repeat domain-containing protein [Cyanobacteriota bacterium]